LNADALQQAARVGRVALDEGVARAVFVVDLASLQAAKKTLVVLDDVAGVPARRGVVATRNARRETLGAEVAEQADSLADDNEIGGNGSLDRKLRNHGGGGN